MRQAVNAVMAGMSLEDYAGDHEELGKALETWSES
jgi:ribulose 1,5-bisphosphate carboxylase large subunit-like protein